MSVLVGLRLSSLAELGRCAGMRCFGGVFNALVGLKARPTFDVYVRCIYVVFVSRSLSRQSYLAGAVVIVFSIALGRLQRPCRPEGATYRVRAGLTVRRTGCACAVFL